MKLEKLSAGDASNHKPKYKRWRQFSNRCLMAAVWLRAPAL